MNVDVLQLMAIAGIPESDLGDVLKAIARARRVQQEARIERRDRIRRMTTNYHRRKRGWKS